MVIHELESQGVVTLLITVITDCHFHTPLYCFLNSLAFPDITKSYVNTPILLSGFLSQHKTAPLKECILHVFFFHFTGSAHVFLLVVMAAECCVATHEPLQYLTVMNPRSVHCGRGTGGWIHSLCNTDCSCPPLPCCGPNTLDNFQCDVPQVLEVICIDTYLTELLRVSSGGLSLTVIFVWLLISCTAILVNMRGQVMEGKHKALCVCIAQVMAISITFIPGLFIYAQSFKTFGLDKVASTFFTVLVPVLNPMVCTLRNTEMEKAVRTLASRVL